ncbi:MAG: hypothetical protein WC975_12305 [Phycisphaerae bacterium]
MSGVELFLDKSQISWERNIQRELCQPVKYDKNPVLLPEYPWEESYVCLYGSILPKKSERGFFMWYMAAGNHGKDQTMCLAESDDGLAWRKVFSGEHPYGQDRETNIVYGPNPNIHGPCVLHNYHDEISDERYLVLYDSYSRYRPDLTEVQGSGRWCYTATSPDGLHWFPPTGRPAIPGKSDTGQGVVWDPIKKRYIAYLRGTRSPHDPFGSPHGETQRVRYVRASVSRDFRTWSSPIELLRADNQDGDPNHQIHQLSVTWRDGQFIGLLSMFHIHDFLKMRDDDGKPLLMEEGTCDTQLVVSRDGMHWHRVADRQLFLPLGLPGEWDSQWIVTASQIVVDQNRMLFYYAATDKKRSEGHRYQIGVAALPLDRFQALKPLDKSRPAVLETKPVYLLDGDLYINADCSQGNILMELCDFNGNTIEGFGKENCTPVVEDNLRYIVRWNNKKISEARNETLFRQAIRIRCYIDRASLYAIYLPAADAWENDNG